MADLGTDTKFISDYAVEIAGTDVLDPNDVKPILLGLYGEVGGIMSTAKKHVREKAAYPGFKRAAEEEFGDTLWYLAALCRRLRIPLDGLFAEAAKQTCPGHDRHDIERLDASLFSLGISAANLLGGSIEHAYLINFASNYLSALRTADLSLIDVAQGNLRKACGAFIIPDAKKLIDFDSQFGVEEQLPRKFKIRINERGSGKSYLQWNGVFIGDPLTDNIADPDGYRFHDVFHFSHAAILHWSPVFRALTKQKRKSRPEYDEGQDGGRAIVVEEGLTAWIFARAKDLNFFAGQDRVSLEILKTIGQFVSGYEVSRCPLKLWERAILDGYSVFRQIRESKGGWVIGDRERRTIDYAPIELEK